MNPAPISTCNPKDTHEGPFLFRPQRLHGIDRSGAASRNHGREQTRDCEQSTDGKDFSLVVAAYTKEKRLTGTRDEPRSDEVGGEDQCGSVGAALAGRFGVSKAIAMECGRGTEVQRDCAGNGGERKEEMGALSLGVFKILAAEVSRMGRTIDRAGDLGTCLLLATARARQGTPCRGEGVSVAAGPVGRDASAETDVSMRAEILSYSRARGLFAGISLEGSTIRPDNDANKSIYGEKISAKDIVLVNETQIPSAAEGLISSLNTRTPKLKAS
jgi:hypothetical protein